MPDIKNLWKDPVWSKVIATAIVALGAAVLATIRGWWPAIWEFIAQAWNWLGESSLHVNWLLIVLWLALGLLLSLIALVAVSHLRSQQGSPQRSWKSYTTDQYFGLQWVWKLDSEGSIYNVFALCLDCKCQVFPTDRGGYPQYRTGFYCDVCGIDKAVLDGDADDVKQRVKLRIQQKMRTGDWVNAKIG